MSKTLSLTVAEQRTPRRWGRAATPGRFTASRREVCILAAAERRRAAAGV